MPHPVRRFAAEILAALVATAAFLVATAIRHTYPFGPTSRNTGDLGTQVVPLHALARDVLTGRAPGDAWFNWSSGLGVPFWPDIATYLGSPLTLLVVAFPRDKVDLAVFVITVLKFAAAAAFMTHYLRRISPGPTLLAASLGVAYALSGWAVDDAAYIPMWLDGLAFLPLLALLGEWAIEQRRGVWAPLIVALAWASNFYTAYMATLGAGLLILARLAVLRLGVARTVRVLTRLAFTFLTGIALAAPLLIPVLRANQAAQPSPPGTFVPAAWPEILGRLLPATEGVGLTPGLYVTTPVLLLALLLPFHSRVPRLVRGTYFLVGLAVVLSLQWPPTQKLWHGFDTPNGSQYRQAFVVCAFLVVLAWLAASKRPRVGAVLLAVGTLLLLAYVGGDSASTTPLTGWVTVAALLFCGLLAAVAAVGRGGRLVPAALVGLLLVVGAEATINAVVVDAERRPRLALYNTWSEAESRAREAVERIDTWPQRRTSPLAPLREVNEPMLVGGQGRSYYSSLMPATTSAALRGLGVGWSGYGRSVEDLPDDGLDALLGVGARVSGVQRPAVVTRPAAPLVMLHPTAPQTTADPYSQRNALLGAEVYSVPPVTREGAATASPTAKGSYILPAGGDGVMVVTGSCPAGTRLHVWAPSFVGTVSLGDQPPRAVLLGVRRPGVVTGAGVMEMGEPEPDGAFTLNFTGVPGTGIPVSSVGCLDGDRLDAAVADLSAGAPQVRFGGHSFRARWDQPTSGVAVASVTTSPGWRCRSGDGGWQSPRSAGGLLAVPLQSARSVECTFRPPGLRAGSALAAVGLVALAAQGVWSLRARRRRR